MSRLAASHPDSGLQPERTLLAWRRTLLSLLAVSALFLRWIPHHGRFAVGLMVLTLLAVALIWLGQWRRYRISSLGICEDRTPAPCAQVFALALLCGILGALGLYVVLYF